jgi:hypothetical protein
MRLFGLSVFDRIKDGVAADADVQKLELTRKGMRQTEKRNQEWRLSLAVEAPSGVHLVEHTCTVPYGKVPQVGQWLPVTVSSGDPGRLRVEWDRVEALGGPGARVT